MTCLGRQVSNMTPAVGYSEMKDSGILGVGLVPRDWTVTKIHNLFFEVSERYDEMKDEYLPLLSVSEYYGVAERAEKIEKEAILVRAATLDGYKKCHEGDIVSNIMLAWKCSLGRSPKNGIVSPAYCVYRPRTGVNSQYYHYLFRTRVYGDIFRVNSTGLIDSRLRLYSPKFFVIQVPVPPEEEQVKIVSYLDAECAKIDAIIAEAKDSIEDYKKWKASVIYEAVTKGIDPDVEMKDSGVEWIGQIPKTWKVWPIKSFSQKIGSGKTPSGGAEVYTDEGIIFLRSQNVYDTGLKLDDVSHISETIDAEMKNTRVLYNDVLLNITGGSIGRCCIYDLPGIPANVNQHVCIIRTHETTMRPQFLRYFWNSAAGPMVVMQYQTGSNRQGLNFEQIGNTKVPVCATEEQDRIIRYLDNICGGIDALLVEKESLIADLESYKKSLIYEVVTGKRKVC